MPLKQKTLLGAGQLFVMSTILVGVPAISHALSTIEQQYLKCSAVARDSARLSCYDLVSREYGQAQAAELEPDEPQPQVAEDEERFVPMSEDMGLSSLERKETDERQTIRAKVTSCNLGVSGKYFFYFENGQVWKQVDSGRQKFEACDFTVTITRDLFGYKMQPDVDKRRVRISRVK